MTPRELMPFVVYSFATTHDALSAEALLQDMGVDVVPVPTPPSLGGLCGISMRVPPEQAQHAERLLANAELQWSGKVDIEDF